MTTPLKRKSGIICENKQIMPFFFARIYIFAKSEDRLLNISRRRCRIMFRPKFRFTYDEVRIIVMALVEFKNQLIAEGRYTDAVDDLLIKFVD